MDPLTTVFDKHMYFCDLSRYDSQIQVNWINIVRDPIERYISNFYYNRMPKRWNHTQSSPDQDWFDKDLSECILFPDVECDMSSKYLTGRIQRWT